MQVHDCQHNQLSSWVEYKIVGSLHSCFDIVFREQETVPDFVLELVQLVFTLDYQSPEYDRQDEENRRSASKDNQLAVDVGERIIFDI